MGLIAWFITFDLFGHGKEVQSMALTTCWKYDQNAYENDKAFHWVKIYNWNSLDLNSTLNEHFV